MRMTKTAITTNNLSHGNFAVAFIVYFLGNFSINIAKQLSNSSGEPCSPFVLGVNTKQAIFILIIVVTVCQSFWHIYRIIFIGYSVKLLAGVR